MMGLQKPGSPGAFGGGGAGLAVFLVVVAAGCGGSIAADGGRDAGGGIGEAGGATGGVAGGGGGGAGVGGAGGSASGGAGGGAGRGGAGGGAGGGGADGGVMDADLDAPADGDTPPDGADAGCGERPNTYCAPGAPYACGDVAWALICPDGVWTCPLGSMPVEACICFDPGPGFDPYCRDGGTPGPCVGDLPSPICGAQCGNGTRDSCRFRRGPQAACSEEMGAEECDGQDFGVETCPSRGFRSGNLSCSAACTIDVSACVACAPLSAPVVSCGGAPVGAALIGDLALAATDTEVGLAWTAWDAPTGYRVSFTRLSPTFAALGTTVLQTSLAQAGVAVAPLPSGWVVGVGGDDGLGGTDVSFYTIDPDGRVIDHVTVESGLIGEDGWWNPMMAARPGGGPLLLWQTGAAVRAAVIADDGRSATTPVSIAIPRDDFITDVAYAGGAFFVASLAATGSWDDVPRRLAIARVETDGRATSVVEALPGEVLDYAALVAGAADLRLVYTGLAAPSGEHRTYWRRLAGSGAAASSAVELARDPDGFGIGARAVALGDDTVVLLDESNVLVRVARVTAAGQIATPAQDVAVASVYAVAAVRRGPEVVFGWISPLGIGLARIAP